jgi:hypothetical protein
VKRRFNKKIGRWMMSKISIIVRVLTWLLATHMVDKYMQLGELLNTEIEIGRSYGDKSGKGMWKDTGEGDDF